MNGLNHFRTTSLRTSPLNLLWELNFLSASEAFRSLHLLDSVGIYPLHLTKVLASLVFYSTGVATHHTCALGSIL